MPSHQVTHQIVHTSPKKKKQILLKPQIAKNRVEVIKLKELLKEKQEKV